MYAYCLNNPVLMSDGGGLASRVCFSNNIHHPMVPIKNGGGSTNYNGGQSSQGSAFEPPEKELTFWEMLFNTDAQVASDAEGYAFYNGVLIIKSEAMGNNAFSFCVIFMGTESDANLVKHEFGHAVHFSQIGPWDYLRTVGIPSVASFWLFQDNVYYESQPWEFIAEVFGQTDTPDVGYLPFSDLLGLFYWLYTMIS